MYFYFLIVILAWIVVKCLMVAWSYFQTCKAVANIPKLYPQHWFWGLLYKVDTPNDILNKCTEYVRQAKPRWFSAWNMFLYPMVCPADPGTMRELLTATNVPKNKAFNGGYRMLEGWIGDGLLVSNGKKWERSRRLLTPAFHFEILKGYVEDFNNVASVFVSKLKELSRSGESVDVFPPVSRATLDSMLRCTVSYNDDSVQNTRSHHPYVVAVNRITKLVSLRYMNVLYYVDWIYNITSEGKEFKTLCDYVHTFSEDIISRRKRDLEDHPTDTRTCNLDFLDILLTAKDSDGSGLSDLDIRNEVDTFVFEGHDTTASAISWILNALAMYPTMQHRVRQEMEAILNGRTELDQEDLSKLQYTTCFIKEAMRLYSPVPWIERRLAQPLKMNGVMLQPGQVVNIICNVLHRNPRVWKDPEEFQPERFLPDNIKDMDPYAFIPFSAGQRNCIGQHFAMNEIKVIIAKTLLRFDISPDPGKTPEPNLSVTLHAKDGVYLHFRERQGAEI